MQGFCEREAISTAGFYRRRSLLSESKAEVAAERLPHDALPKREDFIELGAFGVSGARVEVRLDLGGGVLLRVVRG